jgi:CRP-like cAMP-binding protein
MAEPFFEYLRTKLAVPESQLDRLKPLLKGRHVEKGQMPLRAGEICLYTSFVVKGCLRSYVIDGKGKEHIIQFAPENWWISEQVSFMKGEPAMYFIDAVEDTTFLPLDAFFWEEFNRVVPTAHQFADRLLTNSLRSF